MNKKRKTTIKRARIDIEYGKHNMVCYYFNDKDAIIEIDGQEYDGVVEVDDMFNVFNIKIKITSDLQSL